MKCVFKHQELLMFGLKLNKYGYFQPLEVVGCVSETQRQVGEKLNYLRINSFSCVLCFNNFSFSI